MHQKHLYSDIFPKVKEVLISSWDPIGIRAEPSAQDEYDSFVPAFFELIEKGATTETLSLYLQKIESDDFGLVPNKVKAQIVAERLIQIFSENASAP